ncbi:MAG TPA: methionine synthase [Chloroflexota bacterium]|nr:methionine synthase [Chloroflexota bacterium]
MDASRDLARARVDQVGSLLRPSWLKDVYARHGRGEATDEELRAAQDEAVRAVVARQEAIGFPIVTDGELRRLNFQDSFSVSVSGFAATPSTAQFHEQRVEGGRPGQRWDPGYVGEGPAVVHRRPVVERIALARNLPLEEFRFTHAIAHAPVKVTLIGPDRISQRFDAEGSRAVYSDVQRFVDDVVRVERAMIQQLQDAGCPYVQIDAPGYTAYVDPPSLAQMRVRGEDPDAAMARSMAADNAIVDSFPGLLFGIHLCRGNQAGMWHREGHYDAIAERLFSTLHHQRFLLEYDTERAGSFEPLRFVPRDKMVVLGLVSTKSPEVEAEDELKRRIEEASRFVSVDQLALSPQCGFASDIVGNPLSEDDQWRKLEVVLAVARDVWGAPAATQ